MKHTFTLEYWHDGWYVGKLREVPDVFSQGETIKEQLIMEDEPQIKHHHHNRLMS